MKAPTPKISRQQAWQYLRVAEGNCMVCGKKRNHYKWYCDSHQRAATARQRERLGYKPKRKGHRGRPAFTRRVVVPRG